MNPAAEAWALQCLDAPEKLQECFAENQFMNHFRVVTTEGSTTVGWHEIGARQGDVKACDSTSIWNTVRIECLKNEGLMYEFGVVDASDRLQELIDRVGFMYVDDLEHHLRNEPSSTAPCVYSAFTAS